MGATSSGALACKVPTRCTLPLSSSNCLALPAGQLGVWDGVVPAKLPGPTADLDVLHGVKQKGVPGTTAGGMGGGMADGGSVLLGGAGGTATGTADGGSDEYDREDSFLADSGAKGPDAAPGGGGRRRGRGSRYGGGGGGGAGLSSFDLPQPQEPVQSGATEMGEQ